MIKKKKIRDTSRKISHDAADAGDIPKIAAELIDSCSIEHIESAF